MFPLISILFGGCHLPLRGKWISFEVKKKGRYHLVQLSELRVCPASLEPVSNMYFVIDYDYTVGL